MKKYLFPILCAIGGLTIVFLALFFSVSFKKSLPEDNLNATPEIIAGVKSGMFKDKISGFEILYPMNSEIRNDVGNFLSVTKNAVVQIFVSSTKFDGTNLSEAVVAVGVASDTSTVAICQQIINGDQAQGTVKISGKDFNLFTGTDAGAGNLYEYRDYRRVENGRCYEISEVLHSGNIYNYEPGTIKEFDKSYFSGVLEKIATSFEFVN